MVATVLAIDKNLNYTPISSSKKSQANQDKTNNQDYVAQIDKVLAFSSFVDFPLSLTGALTSSLVKDPDHKLQFTQDWLCKLVTLVSNSYPPSLFLSTFLAFAQSILSASPSRFFAYCFIVPAIALLNSPAEYKASNLANRIGHIQDHHLELTNAPELEQLSGELGKTNAFLSFFMKCIYIPLLISTYLSYLSDISKDNPSGLNLITRPVVHGKEKNIKQYFSLLGENWLKEKEAVISSFEVLWPKNWRGTLFGQNLKIEKLIKQKGYKGISAWVTRLSASSLKTVLSLFVCGARLLSAVLYGIAASQLGLSVFNTGTKYYSKEDAQKAAEHPLMQTLYNLANHIYSFGVLCAGIVPLLSLSPAYVQSSGRSSALVRIVGGTLLMGASISELFKLPPIVGRTLFYGAGPLLYWAQSLRTIYRLHNFKGLTSLAA